MATPRSSDSAALACELDPHARALQEQLAAGVAWPKILAIVLAVQLFIQTAAHIQFGVVLGLELKGPLLAMPIAVGLVLGGLLAAAWHFYRHASLNAQLLRYEQDRNEQILARLEELVELRSAQLRETESQMLDQQKFAALGRMAAGIAHDFNNLLTTMALGAQELADPELEADERQLLVDAISQACERGSGITRQLQASSAAQLHRPQVIDLCEAIRGDLGVWRTLAGSGIEVLSEVPEGPLFVRIDPAQFHRVILNLVVNACQAMGEQGRLRLRVGELPEHEELYVAVSDTGGGIPPSVAERIFEPFFTTRETGTGLGLAVVRGVITQARGRVELEVAGGGTTFTVVLPAVPEDERDFSGELPILGRSKQHLRVALVDADPAVRGVVVRALQRLGHEVEAFGKPADLLSGDARYDLLISDLSLPGLSGPELALGLREAKRIQRVMLMSGYVGEHDERSMDSIPDAVLLQKPFRVEELSEALERSGV